MIYAKNPRCKDIKRYCFPAVFIKKVLPGAYTRTLVLLIRLPRAFAVALIHETIIGELAECGHVPRDGSSDLSFIKARQVSGKH